MKRTFPFVVTLMVVVGLIPFVATPVAAQDDIEGVTYCGDEQYGTLLRLHNPDLNPWNDPAPEEVGNNEAEIESSWQFFIHFQAIVDEDHEVASEMNLLDEIKSFWFGFGPLKDAAVLPNAEGNCEKPWLPGFQLYSYRSDADPSDGFFVPINTTGVPDGTYGYVVYACTETTYAECQPRGPDDPLVAAAWGKAIVDNGNDRNLPGTTSRDDCSSDDLACMRQMDFLAPWPIVLPGDGIVQTNNVDGMTIEFAEKLATLNESEAPDNKAIKVWVNGVDRTAELQDWVPPERDNDLIPGNDGEATGHPVSDCSPLDPIQEVTGQIHPIFRLCQKVVWGDGFLWPGSLSENDEVRLWAMDGAGNEATKVIAFKDATRGGVIPLIETDITVTVDPVRQRVRPGESKIFAITIENTGEDTAHVFPQLNLPDGIQAQIGDDHIDVPGGESETVALQAGPTKDTTSGEYPIEAVFRYQSGQRIKETKAFPVVIADPDASLAADDPDDGGNDGDDDGSTAPPAAPIPTNFQRECRNRADHQVCFLWPQTLTADEPFQFEVQVAQAAERQEDRHDADAGRATLTIEYLGADRTSTFAEGSTYQMEQVSTGKYRAEVTLTGLAPVINAIFDSEVVDVSMIIREAAGTTGDQTGGVVTPGFEAVALVAALGAGALLLGRRRRDG